MTDTAKPKPINVRRIIAETLRSKALETGVLLDPNSSEGNHMGVEPDPTNPYAFVVTSGESRFRVIVKPL